MRNLAVFLICTVLFIGCKSKKKEENTSFFPALSFIKSQVAHVDTSVYSIIKVVTVDSTSDTTYIKREQFRQEADDFLSVPDISSSKLRDDYTETKQYDTELNQVSLSYAPKEDGEITNQVVMIKPGADGDKVSSIFINRTIDSEDSTVQKILFWQVDKRFKITTLVQKTNQPEKKHIVEVIWNDAPSAQ
jgi:hypothetical protein